MQTSPTTRLTECGCRNGWFYTVQGDTLQNQSRVAIPCPKCRLPNTDSAVKLAGIPARYRGFSQQSWQDHYGRSWGDLAIESIHGESMTLAEIAETWIEQRDPLNDWLLFLHGLHGRRKTSVATSVLRASMDNGARGCVWVDFDEWVDEMFDCFGDEENGRWQAVYERAKSAPQLLIDDLGAVRLSLNKRQAAFWRERASLLLRKREVELMPTIITTNLDRIEDLEAINHSLPTRVRAARLVFKLTGPDRRKGNET